MQGKLFGFPSGEEHPVQIQAWMGVAGLDCTYSNPLEPGKEASFPDQPEPPKPATRPVKPVKDYEEKDIKKPDPVEAPGEEPERPGLWTRFIAFFGNKNARARLTEYREQHAACEDQGTKYEDFLVKSQEYEDYQDIKEAFSGKCR